MEFSTAQAKDLAEILRLFRAATTQMDAHGVYQWDEIYPDEGILGEDIARRNLTVGTIDGRIAVAFMLDYCEDSDYESADWQYCEQNIVVLHRLCVHPDFQHRKVAARAMDYIEESLRQAGVESVRLDAFSLNPYALRLYESRGYERAGQVRFRKGLFYLYEKQL